MNILIDINHPAQVHLFKNMIFELQNRHNVIVTLKEIPSAKKLLNFYNIKYYDLGEKSDSLIGKAFNQIRYNYKLWKILVKNKVDIAIGSSITVDHASMFYKTKSIHVSDDDASAVPLTVKFAYPYTNTILCPDCLSFTKFEDKQIQYAGYHELAYLNPKYFQPNINILKEVGVEEGDTFFIMRFNVFKAHHDVGVSGLSLSQKLKLIDVLKKYGKIFITTEREIEPELKSYQLAISPEKIHSLMYYATMFLGDSQTMTSEAAVLGVPALKLNSFARKLSIPNELEDKYGLCYSYDTNSFEDYFSKVVSLLKEKNLKKIWVEKRKKLIDDKIDVTAFMVWFIENYPKSIETLRDDPTYQLRFK